MSDDAVLELARYAADQNVKNDISGALFYLDDWFIQVLEGPSDAVGRVYGAIREDDRHSDVITVWDASIGKRAFDAWPMRLMGADDLSPTEHAIVVQALRSVDAREATPRRTVSTRDLLAGAVGASLARAFVETPRDCHDLKAVDRLLDIVDSVLLRRHGLCGHSLDSLALAAAVAPQTAKRHFRDLNGLVSAGVRRQLAVEHADFLHVMTSHVFESRTDVALAIVDFLTRISETRAELPAALDALIRRDALAFSCDAAWPLAEAICAASNRPGWPCPEVDADALALGVTATAASLRTVLERGPGPGASTPVEDRLLKICDAALAGA